MRAHFDEETARAALLLEAAAYELMRCAPPCARKAAFHLVLAGLRYHAAKQKRLAVHCYLQVLWTKEAGEGRQYTLAIILAAAAVDVGGHAAARAVLMSQDSLKAGTDFSAGAGEDCWGAFGVDIGSFHTGTPAKSFG
jgi:hypothetical protein